MNAVWKQSRSDGRARLVLLAIADHQGEIGAWPSIATLAKMVNSSERSVQRDIQYLQSIGELSVEVQNAPTRQQYKSNLYWVTLPGVTAGVTETHSGVTETHSGVTAGGVQTLIEPLLETNNLTNAHFEQLFDEFWNAYPRKLDKAKAFRAFRSALKRTKFEDIMAGVIGYRNDSARNPDFTKYPATWLNSDSWENAATPSADSEATERAKLRREREKAASDEFLAEQKRIESESKPPVTCKHGKTIALCLPCAKDLNA
jgi:Helix-turn-helix domain